MNGKIIKITPDIIDIRFEKNDLPIVGTILKVESGSFLSVELIESENVVKTIILRQEQNLKIGDKVISTKKPLMAPIGKEALGRIYNVLGETTDKGKEPKNLKRKKVAIYNKIKKDFKLKKIILETGIKAIDFFIPIIKGDKIGLFGGAGLGKTLIIKELIYSISKIEAAKNSLSILTGIGERSREGEELFTELKEQKLLPGVMMYFAQMNETPGARMKIIYPAITSAEYIRDEMKKDVLMFIDNIYRFSQAGSELSSSLGKIPSQSGYQPTLVTEISNVQERLSNSHTGTITSFQTVFVPADDITDPAAVAVFSHLNSSLVLERGIASAGRYPSIDPLSSNSSNAIEEVIGEEHIKALTKAKKCLQRFEELEDLLSILGTDGISKEDLLTVERARKLQNFFTQNFFTAKEFTQKDGVFIPLKKTINSVKRILEGEFDSLDPQDFLYIGDVSEVEHKLKKEEKAEKTLSKKEMKQVLKLNKKQDNRQKKNKK